MVRCKELLNCILLRKVLNFRKRVSKVLIEWYQFDTTSKYMAESLIVEPINFNIICILLDYNFRQVLIRVAFKLCHQLFVKHRAGCGGQESRVKISVSQFWHRNLYKSFWVQFHIYHILRKHFLSTKLVVQPRVWS